MSKRKPRAAKPSPAPWSGTATAGFGYRYVTLTFLPGISVQELEANRRLAEAAPKLLETLKESVKLCYCKHDEVSFHLDYDGEGCAKCVAAESLIADIEKSQEGAS